MCICKNIACLCCIEDRSSHSKLLILVAYIGLYNNLSFMLYTKKNIQRQFVVF